MQKQYIVIFKISETEKKQLDELLEKFGCNKSEFIRQLIRDKHTKTFPSYVQAKKEKSVEQEKFEKLMVYTPEKLCEIWTKSKNQDDILKMDDGILKCFKRRNKSRVSIVPLNKEVLIKNIRDDFLAGDLTLEDLL